MKDKVIFISLDDWQVIYFDGLKFSEGHSIRKELLIRLGMLIQEAHIDISDMKSIYIKTDEVSDEAILWNWPCNIEDLDDEVKDLINKYIK